MRSRAVIKAGVFGAILLFAGIYVGSTLICLSVIRPIIPVSTDTQIRIKDDRLIVQGSINPKLASKLHQVLDGSHEKINFVLLSSVGGDKRSAEAMAADLDELGPRQTIVPSGFTCQSACILLGLGAGNRFEPDDQVTLMFHRSSTQLGPDDCLACAVVDSANNTVRDLLVGPGPRRIMRGWANRLAPGLGDTIARCKPNPFDTGSGIIITGKQFKAYRDGDLNAIPCPF